MWNLFRFRAFKRPNRPRQLRPGTQVIAIWDCHSHLLLLRRSSLPFARLQSLKMLRGRDAGHSHCYYRRSRLPFACPQGLKPSAATSTGSFDQAPQLSATIDRQLRPSTQATVICYYRRSRLPFARPQRPKTFRASHLLLSAFEAAVCPPSKA